MGNSQQNFIIQKAIESYYSNNLIFQFVGEAGTGKSYVLSKIVERLNLSMNNVLPMAFTGQAACVMRTKGLINAKTLDSGLYTYTPVINPSVNVLYNNNTSHIQYIKTLRDLKKEGIKLIILDEGYMIPSSYKHDIECHSIPIIVTGDTAQLGPINSNPLYLINGPIYTLTEQMRQNKNMGIYYLARRARANESISCGNYGNALVIEYNELTNDMIQWANIVLCGTNKTKEFFNKKKRHEILHYNRDVPYKGERIICKKNNWSIEIDGGINLVNGLIGTVTNMPTVEYYNNNCFKINFKPDLCINEFKDIQVNYKYFMASASEKINIKNDKYLEGECFEFGYANTVTSAQGSEYLRGIYIEEPWNSQIAPSLNYTAITRFKQQLIYVKRNRKLF